MNYTIFDGHCDTPIELWRNQAALRENSSAISLSRAKTLGGYAQFFAFCTAWIEDGLSHTEQYRRALAYFMNQLHENADMAALCRTTEDAETAIRAGKAAAFLAIEGAEAIDCDPGRLDEAYEQGVRMISLIWNIDNSLTGSCKTGTGLTQKGKDFFRRAQRLGMVVDVSHLSERGFWDMTELAEKPIVASHSNSAAMCRCVRNLTDEQFRAICQLGGTAGLNLVGSFLSESGTATFEDFLTISSTSAARATLPSDSIWTVQRSFRRASPAWSTTGRSANILRAAAIRRSCCGGCSAVLS